MIRQRTATLVCLLAFPLTLIACGDAGETDSSGGTTGDSTTTSTSASTTSGAGGSSGSTTATTATTGAGGAGGEAPIDVSLAFRGQVGAEVFSCAATYTGLGSKGTDVQLTDFRFYVHDVRLLSGTDETPVELEQDGIWQAQNLALLDFEDKTGACANGTVETHMAIAGTVPAGSYDGIAFKVGVPDAENHGDAAVASSPLNLSGLFWSWQGGYKFMRIDAVPTDVALTPFNLHLGSTGCVGDPAVGETVACTNMNITEIVLDQFDMGSSVIVLDYAAIVEASDLSVNGGGAPGCMSGTTDPECPAVFTRLGLDLATGNVASTQSAFHVE